MSERIKDAYDFIEQASQQLVGYSPESYERLLERVTELIETERQFKLMRGAAQIVEAFDEAIGAYRNVLER